MYYVIFSGWGLGMLGYIVLNKYSRYNNKHYMDIKDFKRQFKKHRDEVNGVEKHNSSGWGK
jgi:hypothetical protein